MPEVVSAQTAASKEALRLLAAGKNLEAGIQPSSEVLHILREVSRGNITNIGSAIVGRFDGQLALLRLGDEETLWQVPLLYQASHGTRIADTFAEFMETSAQAKLIPYLAGDFYREESLELGMISEGGNIAYLISPRSIYSAIIAGRIILRSSAFTDDLKHWVTETHLRLSDRQGFRESWKTWWTQNRPFFEAGDYAKVAPPK